MAKIIGNEHSQINALSSHMHVEPPRVSRRPNFLREYPNEKYLLT